MSILVSLESLKGTCVSPSESALITIPRVTKELLMFFASSNRVPVSEGGRMEERRGGRSE